MADSPEESKEEIQEEGRRKGPLSGLVGLIVVGLVASISGFCIPYFFPQLIGAERSAVSKVPPIAFLTFGEITANINDPNLTRYLRLSIVLQVAADSKREAALNELVAKKKSVLRSWLLTHLAQLGMDDIRGTAGQNRLRREIQDHFSTVLFPEGEDELQDVLFEEFNVQ